MGTEIKKVKFECSVGSNKIIVDGEEKYLSIIVWDEKVKYEDVKEKIVE